MAYRITSNHHDRDFLYRYEVPDAILASQYDHLGPEIDGLDNFLCYRGEYYHLSDFLQLHPDSPMSEGGHWHGCIDFGGNAGGVGLVIRIADDGETYQIGRYLYRSWNSIYSERAELARGKVTPEIRAKIDALTVELQVTPW